MPQRRLTVLLLILLLLNAMLLAAVLGAFGLEPLAGWLESPREPQRVDQQVRRERMQLQPPSGSEAAAPDVPRAPGMPNLPDTPGGTAGAPRGALPGHVTLATARTPEDDRCVEMGGFSMQTVQRAKEDLAAIAAGSQMPVEQFERTEQVRWWVHLPAQPTRENADRKLAELRRRKVTDVSVVSSEEPESYTVSLGLFRERERADKFLESLRTQGVRTALITDAPRPVSRLWLRVKQADDTVRARMDEVRQRYGADVLQACKPAAVPPRNPAGTQARGDGNAAARAAG